MTLRIGIDFGGTKIEAAALDEAGACLCKVRVPNPGSYEAAIAALVDLIARVEAEAGRQGTVGIGAPGSRSPRSGLIRNSNSLYLNGRAFLEDVQSALGREIRLANDANCFALSEAVDGAAAGCRSVFGLIIGTGCGGGLVIDGQVVEGGHGIAGEIGHMPLPWPRADELPAPDCWCGLQGCFEQWVSGTGFSRSFAADGRAPMSAPAIVAAARAGDEHAAAALRDYTDRLGRGLAVVANLIDPDAIVIGGGMSNVAEIYEGLRDVVQRHSFSGQWDGKIVQARWGDSSGVRGAALLWAD
ncbi:ROK family protein [Novosphingobium terrae]|uniref:ROK family protein n=1 Tax=Novosphingobium terrae TaxID=2726189 RepID=UPI00197E0DEC|nr:ROK family protein [Novosphingobium terrae]